MKINLLFNILMIVILSSCQSANKCEDPICFNTSIEESKNNYVVKLEFESKKDTILKLDARMFTTGCPDYWEDQTEFYKNRNPNVLKHNQIILENTDNEVRLLSRQFFSKGKQIPIELPNCAFLEQFDLILKKNKVISYNFFVGKNQNELRVSTSDRKVKLHLYLKNNGHGTIISSSNWIDLNRYISE